MKRAVGYGLLVLVVLFLAGLALSGRWLLCTTDGARWAIATLSRHTSLKISVARVQGRLLDHLVLEGVAVRAGRKEAEIATLKLVWRPLRLLARKVVIDELALAGVVIQDDTPPSGKPVDLSVPRLPGMTDLLDVTVERLTVQKLRYRHLTGKPVELEQLAAVILWHDQVLSLPSLSVRAPAGAVGGSIAVGFRRQALRLDLTVRPAKAAAGMDTFAVRAGLISGRGQKSLAGTMVLTGQRQGTAHLQMHSELGITRTAIKLRRLHLARPGRKGTITGDGSIDLATPNPTVQLVLAAHRLDLSRELKHPAEITGTVSLAGNKDRYQGRFDLANRGPGWQSVTIAASFHGNGQELNLANIDGTALGGRLAGNLAIGWRHGMSASGHLEAKGLDPARIAREWTGTINLAAGLELAQPKGGALRGTVELNVIDSMLHGQPLTGGVKGSFAGKDVQLANLDLHGRGFDIHGAGDLARRLDLTAVVADLSKLVPGTSGEIRLAGWGAWKNGLAAGAITGAGSKIRGHGIGIESFTVKGDLAPGAGRPVSVDLRMQKASYGQLQADTVHLAVAGTVGDHTINLGLTAPEAGLALAVAGGYDQDRWHGTIDSLSGTDGTGAWHLLAPAPLQVSRDRISLGRLAIAGTAGERLEAAGVLTPQQRMGNVNLKWQELNLNRLNPWLKGVRVEGRSSGDLDADILAEKRISFRADAGVRGTIVKEGRAVTIEQAHLHAVGNDSGITGKIAINAAEGVSLEGTIATASPARLTVPDVGTMDLKWRVADLAVLQPWMKGNVKASGALQGRTKGTFLPGGRVAMEGDVSLSDGMLHWQKPQGEGRMALKDVSATWTWQGETLRGKVALTLAEFGQLRGNFTVPVPATFPVAADPNGAVSGALTGVLQEQGVLSAFLPGLVQESHGKVGVDVGVKGSWREPELTGRVQLTGAGAYLPSAGIRVHDLALTANLERDRVTVAFSAASGAGMVRGDGITLLQGWQVASYRGTLSGDRFQVIHLPEMEAAASPQLSFAGDMKKLTVRGEVGLPELLIHGQPPKASVQPSKDVVLEGAPVEKKPSPLALDAKVRVILGDRVLVKAVGLDAQLGGTVDLTATAVDNITSKGEIRVVKGRYKAYGLDLNIDRGRIFYAGGPVNEPLLDVLALRKVGEVRAGVTVTGTTRNPVVKLYSEPAMPDMDILAYMVLGHPLGASSEQAGLMANAAGLLLSTGQSVVLQDQIKNRLGLSTIDIESGQQDAAARMGYKAIPVTPSGTAPSKQADTGVSQSVLTLGKYLTPQLYVSYGRSIFTGANLFRMRYDISRRLQLETETGAESGADLYYKMMFN